jgi:hypothetical protein
MAIGYRRYVLLFEDEKSYSTTLAIVRLFMQANHLLLRVTTLRREFQCGRIAFSTDRFHDD